MQNIEKGNEHFYKPHLIIYKIRERHLLKGAFLGNLGWIRTNNIQIQRSKLKFTFINKNNQINKSILATAVQLRMLA